MDLTEGDKAAASNLVLAEMFMQQADITGESKPLPADRMLTLKEAADYMGYTVGGLRKLVDRARVSHQGKYTEGPVIQFFQSTKKGPIRFKREWLDEFIRDHHIQPREDNPLPTRAAKRPSTRQISLHRAFAG